MEKADNLSEIPDQLRKMDPYYDMNSCPRCGKFWHSAIYMDERNMPCNECFAARSSQIDAAPSDKKPRYQTPDCTCCNTDPSSVEEGGP